MGRPLPCIGRRLVLISLRWGGGGGNGSNWVSCRVGVRQRERGVEEGLDSSPNSEAWAAVGGSLSDLCPHSWLYGKELGKWVWVPRMPAG